MKKKITKALEILSLPGFITKNDIKKRYRQLAKRYHPDLSEDESGKMEEIARAYELLMEYIENFHYSFDSEEISRQYPHEEHSEKFKL